MKTCPDTWIFSLSCFRNLKSILNSLTVRGGEENVWSDLVRATFGMDVFKNSGLVQEDRLPLASLGVGEVSQQPPPIIPLSSGIFVISSLSRVPSVSHRPFWFWLPDAGIHLRTSRPEGRTRIVLLLTHCSRYLDPVDLWKLFVPYPWFSTSSKCEL